MNQPVQIVPKITTASRNLLDSYHPDSSVYFASPKRALLAQPPFATLLVSGHKNLSEQANESLRFARELGLAKPIVVGAVPFDTRQKAYLRVSSNCLTDAQTAAHSAIDETVTTGECHITAVPAPAIFMRGVRDALSRFARGELDKVVLSRTLEIQCENTPNVNALVKKLAQRNSNGYTFAVNLKNIDNDRTDSSVHALVGASPELLISRQGTKVIANPLAGSEPRSDDPLIDQKRAAQLLHSEKDLREHALVVKAIDEALRPFCHTLDIPAKPSLISTPAMWHLSTTIHAELKDPATTSLELALALHPTPAICGYPCAQAQQAIREIENFDRGLFTGIVGWCDETGDGEWVVTIRCAEIKDHLVRLYAGAGIVEGSQPEKELAETGAKFNTMLTALGIHDVTGVAI
ncbi:MAG: isochorismate synthase DhbC [Cellvibrionaceae bacterium]|nr:isochorismate synthase DhbC [Cellvibrionaceae bacterium]